MQRQLVTVASQMRHLPFFQVESVKPSGLFPSDVDRFDGSSTAGILAWTTYVCSALFIKSFIWLCLEFLPICNPHDNPWRPLASTSLPQMHLYGWQSNILPTKSANYWGMNHRAWIIICYYWDVLSK